MDGGFYYRSWILTSSQCTSTSSSSVVGSFVFIVLDVDEVIRGDGISPGSIATASSSGVEETASPATLRDGFLLYPSVFPFDLLSELSLPLAFVAFLATTSSSSFYHSHRLATSEATQPLSSKDNRKRFSLSLSFPSCVFFLPVVV